MQRSGIFFSKVLYQLDEKRAAHYIKNKGKTFIKDLNNALQITAAATPRDPLRAPILLSVVLVLNYPPCGHYIRQLYC